MSPPDSPPLAALLAQISAGLHGLTETPALDAQVWLAQVLGQPRTWIVAHPEYTPDAGQRRRALEGLARLQRGLPLPYLLGEWEFYGASFYVNPAVLIPRPETEHLVETALEWLRTRRERSLVVDIGTGSGCIAASLALHHPHTRVIASDVSRAALAVAQRNLERHHLAGRVSLVCANLLPPLNVPLELICANLPYIPSAKLEGLVVARREPRLALDGGVDGLRLIERVLNQAARRMRQPGLLLFELEANQGVGALALAKRCFPQADVTLLRDYAGYERLLRIHN